MKIGLIGLPNSGKTTIFNALTRSRAEVTSYANTKSEPNLAVIDVIDERVTRLSEIYQPKKTTYATIEIIDFVGLSDGSAKGEAFSGAAMGMIKRVDAIALVVRNFEDGLMGEPAPLDELDQLEIEMLMSDLMIAEKRLERIAWSIQRGQKTDALLAEEKVLKKVVAALNENRPVRSIELDCEEIKLLRGFQFLTQKPLMAILNSDEGNFGRNAGIMEKMQDGREVIEFAGKFEMEISRLDSEEEVRMFMEDIGISESARDRLTQLAYALLGYISFFTVGADEVRAWTIHRGDTAIEAAGAIHSDLSRGFIRAECFTYNDLMECGSEKAIREKGRFRLEGKNYVVQDRDILSIRSSL
ncbi:MAG: redox-regulated ATPase YchF [Syntrophaceae bacterium]